MNISRRLRKLADSTGLDAFGDEIRAIADEMDAQPAEVADEQIAACVKRASTYGLPFVGLLNPGGTPSDFSKRFTAEILALRPVQVPMTDEQADALATEAFGEYMCDLNDDIELALVRKVEAHHGITAQAKKEGV